MGTDAINRHFYESHNRRELNGAAGCGRAGAAGCGAKIDVFLRFEAGVISEASFTASGSCAIIAVGSVLAGRLEGLHWKEAAAMPAAALHAALDDEGGGAADRELQSIRDAATGYGTPGSLKQASLFAIEALHGALEDALLRGNFPVAAAADCDTVLVAMSGGVDSATACLLERWAGRDVIGVTMRLLDSDDGADSPLSCCSSESILEARKVCHSLGIPHLTVDYSGQFREQVIADFVAEYLAGRTPNPCTICNGAFRFPALVKLARSIGAGLVATGHYAKIEEIQGSRLLKRGRDPGKDQSYMLWGIPQDLLGNLEFPLGDYKKQETREIARRAGLGVHDRVDSQDVCFIPDDDYRNFVVEFASKTGDATLGEGEIVDTEGNVIGYHRGYLNFTVGQRRGLGISSPEPLYVVRTDPGANVVVVGPRERLAVSRISLVDINAFLPLEDLADSDPLMIQVRYNSPPIPCSLAGYCSTGSAETEDRASWEVELDRPAYGIAPGQSGVIYKGDTVVAGGVIAVIS